MPAILSFSFAGVEPSNPSTRLGTTMNAPAVMAAPLKNLRRVRLAVVGMFCCTVLPFSFRGFRFNADHLLTGHGLAILTPINFAVFFYFGTSIEAWRSPRFCYTRAMNSPDTKETDIHSDEFLNSLMRRQLRLSVICAAAFLVAFLG